MILYTKQNCPRCDKAKELIKQVCDDYVISDITNSETTLNSFRKQFPEKGFPVLDMGGRHATFSGGLVIEALERLLKEKVEDKKEPEYFWGK